eukprot:1141701-Pelagomonas_calceolata.AAC.3
MTAMQGKEPPPPPSVSPWHGNSCPPHHTNFREAVARASAEAAAACDAIMGSSAAVPGMQAPSIMQKALNRHSCRLKFPQLQSYRQPLSMVYPFLLSSPHIGSSMPCNSNALKHSNAEHPVINMHRLHAGAPDAESVKNFATLQLAQSCTITGHNSALPLQFWTPKHAHSWLAFAGADDAK